MSISSASRHHDTNGRTQLWHKDVRLPNGFVAPTGAPLLTYSKHAVEQCQSKGIRLFKSITLRRFSVIEVETLNGRAVKYVLRGAYDADNDIIVVVMPTGGAYFVKTCWLNHKDDTHNTLDRSRYVR